MFEYAWKKFVMRNNYKNNQPKIKRNSFFTN